MTDRMIPSIFFSIEPDALLRFLPDTESPRSTFAGIVFVLTTAGRAGVEVDGHPYSLQPGTLLTLLPSHLLHTTLCEKDFRCQVLAFTFDAMADFPYMLQSYISEKMSHMPFIQLTMAESVRLENSQIAISGYYRLPAHPSWREILRSLIFVFIAEVSAIYSGRPVKASATHCEELTEGFFRLLHEYFRSERETAFYAGRLCISSKYLSRIISRVTGHVPSYWMADFTVREAKMLLKSTTLTVTQLSEKLNFPNSSFFARYFKRHAGVAPLAYRSGCGN